MALTGSFPISLSAIQSEFGAGSLAAAATAASLATLNGTDLVPDIAMSSFLGRSSFSATLYDYVTPGVYTWTKPSGANTIEAICVAGGGAGGGCDGYNGAGGGGGGQAYYFSIAVTDNINILVGAGGVGRVNGQGNNGSPSAMSNGVTCYGGIGGYPGGDGAGGDGGASGNGNPGGVGDSSGSSSGGGGGGGNGGAGSESIYGGGGGDGSTYTLAGGTYSYYVSPGGRGAVGNTGVPTYYGGGGSGMYGSYNTSGQVGRQGRVVFYARP